MLKMPRRNPRPGHQHATRLALAACATLSFMLLLSSEGYAQYTPNIQGGGSTLAAPTYRQDFNCFGTPLTNPPDPASDTYVPPECTGAGYPIDTTTIVRYVSIGSGRGRCMCLVHDPTYSNDPDRSITEVDFAGSDATLSTDQIDKFTNGGTLGSESSACAGVLIPAQAPLWSADHGAVVRDGDYLGDQPPTRPPLWPFCLLRRPAAPVDSRCGSSLYTGASQSMPTGLPSNFVPAAGSGGVEAAILGSANLGDVSYLSPDFTALAAVGGLRL